MGQLIVALVSGMLLGIGLVIANLTDPSKVIDFLDVAGNWDPSVGVVVGCAVVTAAIGFKLAGRRGQPLFAPSFGASRLENIDKRLIIGSGLFGIGWGLSGFCPAPGFLSALFGQLEGYVFIGAMFAGMAVFTLARK